MAYLALMLVNVVCTSLYVVGASHVMKREGIRPNLAIAITHLLAALLLLPVFAFSGGHMAFTAAVGLLALVVVLKLLAKELHFFATAHLQVAEVTVFSAFTPMFGLLLGLLLLGETASTRELIGIALVCVSVYGFFLIPTGRAWVTAMRPLHMLKSWPCRAALLSAFPPALSAIFLKEAGQQIPPLHAAFFSSLCIGALALCIQLPRNTTPLLPLFAHRRLWLIGLAFAIAQWSYVAALTYKDVAHTLTLERLGILCQMALATLLLHEQKPTPRQIAFGICMVFGCVLMEWHA